MMKFAILLFLTIGVSEVCFGEDKSEEAPKAASHELSNSKAYTERVQKLNRFTEETRQSEQLFRDLVVKKNSAKSNSEKHSFMTQMKEAYKQYSVSMDEMIKVKKELKYRFPTGEDINPEAYAHVEKQSMKELEVTTGIDATLNDAKALVEARYRPLMPKPRVKPKSENKETESAKKPLERLRLER